MIFRVINIMIFEIYGETAENKDGI